MDMPLLEEIVPDSVWVAKCPFRFFGMVEIGARMTVLRCGDGHHDLVIHSPIAITPELKAEIDALGTVRYVIAPSLYHHVYIGSAIEQWPAAKVLAPAKLRQKRKDLRIDYDIETATPSAIKDAFDLYEIRGTMLGETVFFHRPSKTLVTADLFENFVGDDVDNRDAFTRLYLKTGGIYKKPGWHRLLRVVFRDKKAIRESLNKILDDVDMERIIISHGELVTERPKEMVREALSFLLD